jgi:choline dehydrogenase
MSDAEYDFVVIGAGSAGCAVVDGLSRCGRYSVLVIEAGGADRNLWIKVPVGYAMNFRNRALNWAYHTQPDPGLQGRSVYWPRGRVVGGSSSINAMAYMRGLPIDFDDWARSGATGWGWSDVRPAFEQMENRMGLGGPVHVTDLSDQMNPFSERFLQAGRDCGLPVVDDPSTLADQGIGYYRSTVRNGVRFSAADAFLRPALRRPNVRCVTNAVVEKVILRHGRAIGVRYRVGTTVETVQARAEVVLSAGAINSPKVLTLSGIGDGQRLKALGIPVVADVPQVGQGLQDHLAVSYQFRAKRPTLNNILGRIVPRGVAGLQYLLWRRGALAVPVNQVGGYAKSSPDLDAPDLQVYCNPMSYWFNAAGKPRTERSAGFLLSAQLCRPQSRGEVRITTPDPNAAPEIHPNSLSADYDQQGAIRSVQAIHRLAAAASLAAVTGRAITPLPDAENALEDFRARASTVFHPTSTCRMGRDRATSVVDSRCRVHGVEGLRVVDASVFPAVTSGNTNAPTMMLAMRAAQMIIADQIPHQRSVHAT